MRRRLTYTWTYTDCEGNTQDYVHTVTIEYDPFPAIPPTTDVVTVMQILYYLLHRQ
jgi:hypothetical protein